MTQLTLDLTPTDPQCGSCAHLKDAINTGVRYCDKLKMWRWADERPHCRHHTKHTAEVCGADKSLLRKSELSH